jgi:hypothetical protein
VTKCRLCYGENEDGENVCQWCNSKLVATQSGAEVRRLERTNLISVGVIIAAIIVFGAIGVNRSCGGGKQPPTHAKTNSAPKEPTHPDALEKMAAVFVGAPSRERIKSNLDRTLILYGLPIGEENYNRYGSVLVRMRQESGISEMELLQFVISLREEAPDIDVSLTDAIALGATTLETVR